MIVNAPLTNQELALLTEVLDGETRALQHEISHTDGRRMKDDLRRRLRSLRRLDGRLRMIGDGAADRPQPAQGG